MPYIGKLDRKLYSCISNEITTDDVIITEERIQHIRQHHPGHFEVIEPYLYLAINEPDYILENMPSTAILLKEIVDNDLRLQIVLRLHTVTDQEGFQNSIISAWQIRDKEYRRLLRNKVVLYKRE